MNIVKAAYKKVHGKAVVFFVKNCVFSERPQPFLFWGILNSLHKNSHIFPAY